MKKMKKLFALVAAVATCLTLGATAIHAEGGEPTTTSSPTPTPTTYTIKAPNNNHVYEIYQIFTGDYSLGTLSNIKWGVNGTGYDTSKTEQDKVSEEVLTALENVKESSDKDKLAVIESYIKKVDGKLVNPITTISKDSTKAKSDTYNALGGYYLIKDKDGSVSGTDAYTTYVVKVIGGFTITPKSDVPSSYKKVKDTNDTTGNTTTYTDPDTKETTEWIDSADYDIGDKVPFQLTGIVASKYDDYSVYKFTFHDKESDGLTFDDKSVKVYVDGTLITTGYEVVTNTTDGDTFDVVFADLKQIKDPKDSETALVKAGSVITVEYSSTLNTGAVIGSAGNPNVMHLEFSNNPNDAQGGETGTTPEDKVIVFTYKTVINKVAKNSKGKLEPLTGAEFTLEKKVLVPKDEDEDEGEDEYDWVSIDVVKNDDGTTFTFNGLDDGTYRLRETATPTGYNTIEPIEFTITAEHDVLSDDPKLTGMKIDGTDKFTVDVDSGSTTPTGSISAQIENKKGTILPSTGGIGTTVFYVTGAILMLGAGVLLVSRKRVSK